MSDEVICDECKYQVNYIDEDKWGEVCGKCGTLMAKYKGFNSYNEYLEARRRKMKAAPVYNDEAQEHLIGYRIFCPGCKEYHLLDFRWEFNDNFEKPTFTPSLKCMSRHPKGYSNENPAPLGWVGEEVEEICHTFITDGKIQFLGDCSHSLKGQTVDLQDVESW